MYVSRFVVLLSALVGCALASGYGGGEGGYGGGEYGHVEYAKPVKIIVKHVAKHIPIPKPYPVYKKVLIPKPYPVFKPLPVAKFVPKHVVVPVVKHVYAPYPVLKPVPVAKPFPVPKPYPVPVPVKVSHNFSLLSYCLSLSLSPSLSTFKWWPCDQSDRRPICEWPCFRPSQFLSPSLPMMLNLAQSLASSLSLSLFLPSVSLTFLSHSFRLFLPAFFITISPSKVFTFTLLTC